MRLSAWSVSDVGRVRAHNEDSYLVVDSSGLFLVADGMGGHAGGAHASQACVEVVAKVVQHGLTGLAGLDRDAASAAAKELLGASASEASARIYDRGQADSSLHGMGTTLTGLLFYRERAHVVHVGDSRCYLFRGGVASQLTHDHTWLNEQLRAGLVSAEEAETSDLKHIITRSVGFEREVQADLMTVNVCPGDAFLLCSDGMSNYIDTEELMELAREHFVADLPQVCVDLVLDRGGDDNVTVVTVMASNGTDRRVTNSSMHRTVADTVPLPSR